MDPFEFSKILMASRLRRAELCELSDGFALGIYGYSMISFAFAVKNLLLAHAQVWQSLGRE
jgi:hypothetical protein